MARRIDFYGDPGAPAANSIVPSVNVAVTNDAGELLLIRRSDTTPGRYQAATSTSALLSLQRQCLWRAASRPRHGPEIYTDPRHVILYTSDGEVRQEFSIVLTAIATGGGLAVGSETTQARWVKPGDVARY
jgi:hypothetical protein